MAEKPKFINSDFSNYMRLQILLHKTNNILRRLFITEWNLRNRTIKWEDSCLNRQDFIHGPGKELYRSSQKIQKECLSSRNISEWDLPLLIQSLRCLKADAPYNVLEELKSLRNKLEHLGEPKISDKDYVKYWEEICVLLLKLGLSQVEIDQVKSTPIETPDQTPELFTAKVKKLKDSGNEAFKSEMFEESIDYYTKAICTPGTSNKVLAELYSDRSFAFLKLEDFSSAKEDAEGSIHLLPTWWKGYYILGMAYKAIEKYQMALKNLRLAQLFHVNPNELDDQVNLCKRLIGQQNREEHFDPMNFATTFEELAQVIPNVTPNSLKLSSDFAIKYMGADGMCIKGHNYYYGRGVPQDYKEAAKWYGKAAAVGNAQGLYNLSKMYMEGRGVECNFNEGMRLLEQAASQSNPIKHKKINIGVCEAQHVLGLSYEEGTGVPRDYEKARYWYTRAIKNWSGPSANNMAHIYIKGKAVVLSPDIAFQYWKIGAAMGNVRCMENLTIKYFLSSKFENMQRWYLYAIEHKSVYLKVSNYNFQDYFQETITKNFEKEKFTEALWQEIEKGPLKYLIDKDVRDAYDFLRSPINNKSILRVNPVNHIDSSTADAYKKSITIAHRTNFKEALSRRSNKNVWIGNRANLDPKPITNLFNLKPISLEEMRKKNQDHIYEGFVLKLTIIEDTIDKSSESAAICTIAQDEQKSYERLFIYNYHPAKNDLQENIGFGSKISIVNPYYRITRDGSPGIRVDDFNTVFMHSNLKNIKLCRYCGNGNCMERFVPCRTCKRCYYCSKKCLKLDASELQHYLVCKKRL